jgi:hypothetical protein
MDTEDESLGCLFERQIMGWHTDEWQSVQTTGGIRLAHPHREGRRPRQNSTHSVWEPSKKPIAKGGEARPGEQQNSHRPKSVTIQWTFCGALERMGV